MVLGIDIGGTNTKYGLVDNNGQIHIQGSISTIGHAGPGAFVTALHAEIQKVAGGIKITGIGVGAPNGNINTGEIIFAPNMPWRGIIPLAKLLETAFGVPTILTNDANAAAIGEMKFGAAKGIKDFILVTLGTGVGSGFVANGQLIYGHDGFAGELGHMIAIRNGRICGCGRKGCLEAYTSATGIVKTAHEWLEAGKESTLSKSATITSEGIYKAAVAGDAMAIDLLGYTGSILGMTLADAVAVTSPEAIIFFGGLAQAGDLLLGHVKNHLEANLLNIYQNKIKILPSALPGSDSAILGAAALVNN